MTHLQKLEYQREYYRTHKEQQLTYQKKYRQRNADYHKRYYRENKWKWEDFYHPRQKIKEANKMLQEAKCEIAK